MKGFGMKKVVLLIGLLGLALAGTTGAVGTIVSGEITGDAHWTKAGMPYSLSGIVYVRPGGSLTIDAGVVVATYKVGPGLREGTLVVCRGGKLYVNGTPDEPVIFTSAEDAATWTGSVVTRTGVPAPGYPNGYVTMINTLGDPKTGVWRDKCLEWGSIAILGEGYISASHYKNSVRTWDESLDGGLTWTTYTNTKCPSGTNKARMEGTESLYTGDTRILYGGSDDNDDSGSIRYLSIRYGGKVIVDTDELNGLSLGGVGRGTDISHVEIMNNVDDGIEIWGGTVNLSHVSIWNIGDDSLDIDQGWRGSAQYGLIVQGYSQSASQGSGVGDNCFEIDGAEDADAQPVTTAKISYFTVVGQPGTEDNPGGDGGTAWRDNARVQFDRCIWMDLDDQLILFDCQDGDGADGYDGDGSDATKLKSNTPPDGTLNWDQHWTTSYNTWKASAYADPRGCGINFADLYEQWMGIDPDGMLCQITNSVILNNATLNPNCYSEYDRLAGLGANFTGNVKTTLMPIMQLNRGPVVTVAAAYDMAPVTFINPLPANDALAIGAGGFRNCNWLAGWTAAYAFGMTAEAYAAGNADINCDGVIDMTDLAALSGQWLQ